MKTKQEFQTQLPDEDWKKNNLFSAKPGFTVYDLQDKSGELITKIHYTADPDITYRLLSDPRNNFSLSHYDRSLLSLKRPMGLLLGEEQKQEFSWKILAQALALDTSNKSGPSSAIPGLQGPWSRLDKQTVSILAKAYSKTALDHAKRSGSDQLDLVRNYGFFVPYLVGIFLTGLKPIETAPIHSRGAHSALNLILKNRDQARFDLKGSRGSSNTYLLWTLALFGQIFGNFADTQPPIRKVAGLASSQYFKQIQKSMMEHNAGEFTLLGRLQFLEKNITSEWKMTKADYDYSAICLLLEIMTSFHILIGLSFANIVDTLIEKKIRLTDFVADLRTADTADDVLNSILSENSTTAMLYRTARTAFPEFKIRAGDTVCFLVKEASKFVTNPKRSLNFGPHETCPYHLNSDGRREHFEDGTPIADHFVWETVGHPCFGQFWAREILRQMFINLVDPETGLARIELPERTTRRLKEVPQQLHVKFYG